MTMRMAVLGLLFVWGVLRGAGVYVSPGGDDAASGGTAESAVRTWGVRLSWCGMRRRMPG
jgi:hypothetical protein